MQQPSDALHRSTDADRPLLMMTPTFDLGRAQMPLDRAVVIAAELEDEQLLRKRESGK
ncbi:hypothetical protein [Parafrigoribacterium mesophilum]|uniref:hypothetical protein n=1 Tax=Parafrigoribacterium mesophilum TaxID=433646 RepID=UPI0031FD73BC